MGTPRLATECFNIVSTAGDTTGVLENHFRAFELLIVRLVCSVFVRILFCSMLLFRLAFYLRERDIDFRKLVPSLQKGNDCALPAPRLANKSGNLFSRYGEAQVLQDCGLRTTGITERDILHVLLGYVFLCTLCVQCICHYGSTVNVSDILECFCQ